MPPRRRVRRAFLFRSRPSGTKRTKPNPPVFHRKSRRSRSMEIRDSSRVVRGRPRPRPEPDRVAAIARNEHSREVDFGSPNLHLFSWIAACETPPVANSSRAAARTQAVMAAVTRAVLAAPVARLSSRRVASQVRAVTSRCRPRARASANTSSSRLSHVRRDRLEQAGPRRPAFTARFRDPPETSARSRPASPAAFGAVDSGRARD